MINKFEKMTVCLDMFGCPNRCKHCWIGHSPNGNMTVADLMRIAGQFKKYAREFEISDWYREPDFNDDYKQLWDLLKQLSDGVTPHYELISVWRLLRDGEYVKWLSSLGVRKVQLTLFGGERATDYYTGRKGAYKEILQAMDILIENRISPRIQIFVNKDNVGELPFLEKLIEDKNLVKRCADFGGEFTCFIHQGSCEGENAKLYDVRITQDDVEKIPLSMIESTLKHFNAKNTEEVFGQSERDLYKKLICDSLTESYVADDPVFYVDGKFNVYPNLSAPAPYWRLGNLNCDSAEEILQNYLQSKSFAQSTRLTVPICQIVKSCGDPDSLRLFVEQDYIFYLLNKYCEKNAPTLSASVAGKI